MPPGCWETWRGRPAISAVRLARRRASAASRACARRRAGASSSSATRARVPAVGDAREPLQLGERQPERLADVADRAARAVGGEARDERRVLAAVALGDARRSASRGCRAGSRGRCRARRPSRGSGSGRARARRRPGRRARARSGSRRSSRPSCRGRARAAARARASRGPRTSSAHLARELEHLPVEAGRSRRARARSISAQLLVEPLACRGACGRSRSRSARRTRCSQIRASCAIGGLGPSEKSG